MQILPCFTCGKQLKSIYINATPEETQPSGASTFTAYGQYGSAVFDPMESRQSIRINICDECLVTNSQRVAHDTTIKKDPEVTTQSFNQVLVGWGLIKETLYKDQDDESYSQEEADEYWPGGER